MDATNAALAFLQAAHPPPPLPPPLSDQGWRPHRNASSVSALDRNSLPSDQQQDRDRQFLLLNLTEWGQDYFTGNLPDAPINTTDTLPVNWTSSPFIKMHQQQMPLPLDYDMTFASILALIFSAVLVVLTVIGNICVIAAVYQSKALQAPQNKLIVSLALADLLVGMVVMPFAAITDFVGKWILGSIPCDIWAVLDVCLCTSSILHLVAIAVDRYFSITNMRYIQTRSLTMMYWAIAAIWILSLLLSVGPVFGWRDDQYDTRILQGECLISQEVSFQIFATTVAFYGPLIGILVLYGLIFQRTRSRVRKRMKTTLHSTLHEIQKKDKDAANAYPLNATPSHSPASTPTSLTPAHVSSTFRNGTWTSRIKLPRRKRSPGNSPRRKRRSLCGSSEGVRTPRSRANSTQTAPSDEHTGDTPPVAINPAVRHCLDNSNGQPLLTSSINELLPHSNRSAKKTTSSMSARHQTLLRREKKAATTLAIITLSFVVCWLPFFVWAVVKPTHPGHTIPRIWEALFLWLGYINSTLNPLIYTIFSPDFRTAFKKMFHLEKR